MKLERREEKPGLSIVSTKLDILLIYCAKIKQYWSISCSIKTTILNRPAFNYVIQLQVQYF